MWNIHPSMALEVAARTAIVYAVLVLLIRLSGKREIGQMTPFDLVVLLLISNAVQNAMTGPDTTVTGGLIAAVTLIVLNAGLAAVRYRWPHMRRFVEGVPVVLVSHGDIQFRSLRHEGITEDELMQALREHEVADVKQVELAMLEIDGSVSVIRTDSGGGFHRSHRRLTRHAFRPNQ